MQVSRYTSTERCDPLQPQRNMPSGFVDLLTYLLTYLHVQVR